MAGYGVGGAAASGLQAGFDMGLRADDAAERRRIASVAENRQAMLDTERQAHTDRANARVDKIDAQAEEDRALEALNKEREDLALEGAGLSAQYGGPAGIPGEVGTNYVRRANEIGTRRAALLSKRYAPVVEKEQQWAKNTASRIQAGQQSLEELTPTETVRLLQALTRRPVGDFLAGEGGKSRIRQAVDDTTAGIETQNQGLLLQGAGALLDPELQEGVGHSVADGSEIVRKELYGLVPAMPGPEGLRAPGAAPQSLAATLSAVLNPNPQQQGQQAPPPKLMPVLRVVARHPDGTEVAYHAPVTKGRGAGADDEVHPGFDLKAAMDRLGQLGALEAWANTPEARKKIEAGLKELGAESNSFLGAYYAMKGNPNALLPPGENDPVSKKIAAVQKLAKEQFNGDFKQAMLAYEGRTELGPLAKKLADIEASGLSPEDKATAMRVAAMGVKAAGYGGGGKDSGGGAAGSSPALGGAEAPGVGKEAVDFWARAVIAGDRDWQVGLARSKSGSQMIEAVKRRVPELAKEMGLQPQDIGTVRAQKAALDKTLKELTVRSEAIELFASKVEKDMKTFDALLDKASAGVPTILSRPINVLRREFSSPELAQLDLAAKQVATEYERLITGGALSIAQLHVGAQEDARKLINGDMTPKQARAVMETMNAEMQNARAAAHESRKRVTDQMRNLGTGAPDTGGAAPAPAAGAPVATFADEAAAKAAEAAGTLKKGTRIKIGNQTGTWQ